MKNPTWEGNTIQLTRRRTADRQTRLQMSSMIDVVFLLLIFFVMTFQIIAREGDFHVTAPGATTAGPPPSQLPLYVRLASGPDGRLRSIHLNDRRLADLDELHHEIVNIVDPPGTQAGSLQAPNVVLQCDDRLDYGELMRAITAVRGYLDADRDVIDLIQSIRLARRT